MIKNLTFKDPFFKYANYPFPDEVANDPMVLYHATSSCFEKEIEAEGLKVGRVHFKLEELQSIAKLFDQLGWMGRPGSMTTLQPFSISHDHQRHGIKPIYLGSSSYEVISYAGNENPGGEIAKAVRYCFQDLHEFLNNQNLRDEYQALIKLKKDTAAKDGYIYEPPVQKISLHELKDSLKELESINRRALSLFENTEYGLVYAIKFKEVDSKDLLRNDSMGIKFFKNISPDQIIAKSIVPREYRPKLTNDYYDFRIPADEGILKHVAID